MLQTAYSGRRWSLEDTAVQDRWFILGTVGIVFLYYYMLIEQIN